MAINFIRIPARFLCFGFRFIDSSFNKPDGHVILSNNEYLMDDRIFVNYQLSDVSLEEELYNLLEPYSFKVLFKDSFPTIFQHETFDVSVDISDSDLLLLKLSIPS